MNHKANLVSISAAVLLRTVDFAVDQHIAARAAQVAHTRSSAAEDVLDQRSSTRVTKQRATARNHAQSQQTWAQRCRALVATLKELDAIGECADASGDAAAVARVAQATHTLAAGFLKSDRATGSRRHRSRQTA